jgi:hypothetical protein
MAKHFIIEYPNGFREEESSPFEAKSYVPCDGCRFFLRGKEVTAASFVAGVTAARDAKTAKKEQTHKRARVLHGSSATCYVEKWVRK